MLCSLNPVGTTSFATFMKLKGEHSWDYFKDHLDELEPFLQSTAPGLKSMLRVDQESLRGMQPTRLITNKSSPWTIGKCTILGDAAHAMSPVGGLGGNYGVLDAQLIDDFETEFKGDWKKIVEKVEAVQKPQVDVAGEFCLTQFYFRVKGYYENETLHRTMCFDTYLAKTYDFYISPVTSSCFLPNTF